MLKLKCQNNFFFLDLITIDEKIKLISLASFHKTFASSFCCGTAFEIILNQCFDSFDSILQIPNFVRNPFSILHNLLQNNWLQHLYPL